MFFLDGYGLLSTFNPIWKPTQPQNAYVIAPAVLTINTRFFQIFPESPRYVISLNKKTCWKTKKYLANRLYLVYFNGFNAKKVIFYVLVHGLYPPEHGQEPLSWTLDKSRNETQINSKTNFFRFLRYRHIFQNNLESKKDHKALDIMETLNFGNVAK